MISSCPTLPINSPSGVVYLCCDLSGTHLYIGQTVDWRNRRRGHMRGFWWPRVAAIHFIPAFGFEERMRTERALIRTLDPEFNVAHTMRAGTRLAPVPLRSQAEKDSHRNSRSTLEKLRYEAAKAAEARGDGPREIGLGGFVYGESPEAEHVKLTCGHCLRMTVTTKSVIVDGETVWLCGPESGMSCYIVVTEDDHPMSCATCQHVMALRKAAIARFLAGGPQPGRWPQRVKLADPRWVISDRP